MFTPLIARGTNTGEAGERLVLLPHSIKGHRLRVSIEIMPNDDNLSAQPRSLAVRQEPTDNGGFARPSNPWVPATSAVTVPNTAMGSKNADELLLLNRVPSHQEISLIKRIISDDMEELSALKARIEKRQAAVDLSQRNVNEIQATIRSLEIIQSARKTRLHTDMDAQRELSGTELPPVPTTAPQKDYEVPKISDISHYRLMELQKCQARVQEGIEEIDKTNRWMSELRQTLLESRSRLKEENSSLDAIKMYAIRLQGEIYRRNQLISAFRRFPSEVLQLIFQNCILAEIEEIKWTPSRPQSRAVITLSAVCARWRRLIAAYLSLWTYVPLPKPTILTTYQRNASRFIRYLQPTRKHVILDYPQNGPWEWDVEVVKTVVSPSKKGPISTQKISTESTSVTDGIKYFADNMLSPYHLQWKGVTSFEILFRKESSPLEIAQCLWPAESYCIRNGFLRFGSTCATPLQHLILDLPLCGTPQMQDTLQNLINLRTFKLVVKTGNTRGVVNANAINLPHLHRFTSSTHLLFVLLDSYIVAPSLRQMGVLGKQNDIVDDWEPLASRLSLHTNISLVKFSDATSLSDVEEQFVPMLGRLSSLVTIELEGQYMLPLVEYLSSNQHIGAKIQTMFFRRTDIPEDILRRFIAGHPIRDEPSAGNEPRRNITSITFDRCTGITQSFCEELKELIPQLSIYC
ncbi:hypothetical protein FRC14_005740 [Serendipita sp. 396]|nr:hypothetical protein FRC14_005740 [Serendipita sp. 396]KAG8780321.1 hypothetical protein FRC15_009623 [Serendipita sp. 397]KAG8796994.1 hypothetical protein FRC16_009303 [Serendipita sp. 398]KAG8865610.1 hypothetical protein FRC20_009642 [Serendipita sp. 405]